MKIVFNKTILFLTSIITIISLVYLNLIIISSPSTGGYFPFYKTMTFMTYASLTPSSFFAFVMLIFILITIVFLILSGTSVRSSYMYFILGLIEVVIFLFILINITIYQFSHQNSRIMPGPAFYILAIQIIEAVVYGWPMQVSRQIAPATAQADVQKGSQFSQEKPLRPIGDYLKERREAAGLTQRELAEKVLVSRQTIHRWETGKSHPDMEYMISVAETLNFSITEFWGNDSQSVNNEIGNVVRKRNAYRQSLYLVLSVILVSFAVSAVAFLGQNVQSPNLDRMNPFISEKTGYAMVTQKGRHRTIVFDDDVGNGNIVTLNGYSNKTEFVKVVHKGAYARSEVRAINKKDVPENIRENLYMASHYNNLQDALKQVKTTYDTRNI